MTVSTIFDVAELAGVSIKTVSRVLNREGNVRAETRARVFEAVDRLAYRPNISARALAGRRAYLIGLFYDFSDNPVLAYVAAAQTGAMTACRAAGYHLLVEEIASGAADIAGQMRALVSSIGLDGVVLTPPVTDCEPVLDILESAQIPYVRLAPDRWPGRSPQVDIDDREAARRMTRYLWEIGHRRIAFIEGPAGHRASHARREGYLLALSELGAASSAMIDHGQFDARSGAMAAERLLAERIKPTAIFAGNDDMALGVVSAALAAGLRLPADLSVAGFDDSPAAKAAWPPLTTIRQPVAEMTRTAVNLLVGADIADDSPSRTLDFELVVRLSTAPPA